MMSKGLRYTLCIFPLLLIVAGVVVAGRYFRRNAPSHSCSEVRISYAEKDAEGVPEVNPQEICERIEIADGTVIGKRLEDINLDAIEKALMSSSVISKAQAWVTDDGILHLDLTRRVPVLWLQDGERGYLVDKSGYAFQLPGWDRSGIPVVRGPFATDPELGIGMIAWMQDMKQCGIWNTGLREINVDGHGNISFKLGDRDETILFGSNRNFADKAARLQLYCSSIATSLAEGKTYNSVNLKYDRQIVCR